MYDAILTQKQAPRPSTYFPNHSSRILVWLDVL